MVDVSIVNETSPEANWNRQAGRQMDRLTGKPMCWEAVPPKITHSCGKWASPLIRYPFLGISSLLEMPKSDRVFKTNIITP